MDDDNAFRLIGVVTVDFPYYIVCEFCEHGSVDYYLEPVDLPEHGKILIAGNIAKGKSHVNHVGFVHRDLAARNVLVDSALQSKVADFGMTRQVEEEEGGYYRSKGGVVHVRWSAPEALQDRKFSQFSDVWALGMTIFEAWTNAEKPYNGWSNDQVWTRVLGSEDAEPHVLYLNQKVAQRRCTSVCIDVGTCSRTATSI